MKKIYLLIFVCSVLGCSEHAEIESLQECKYIDYMTCPEESITPQDRFLLDHIDFQEGELVCLLDADAVAEQGISEQKYAYFLEYLQNKNREIKVDLDSGKIVVYNGKPFTRNEELYQYIEMPDQVQTKAPEYMPSVMLESITMVGSSINPTTRCSFDGPTKIAVSVMGRGTFEIEDRFKGLKAVLGSTEIMTQTTFKYGIKDDVFWDWEVKYRASAYQKGTLSFSGSYQKVNAEESPSGDSYYDYWGLGSLPPFVQITRIREGQYKLSISGPGHYRVQIYQIIPNGEYILHEEIRGSEGSGYLSLSEEWLLWMVIYEELGSGYGMTLEYLGDAIIFDPGGYSI